MDSINSAVPPNEARKRNVRDRTPSFNSVPHIKGGVPKSRPSTLRNFASNSSMRSVGSDTDRSEIIAPVPRRHLLQTAESSQWLRLDTFSDTNWPSRGISPVSATSSVASNFPTSTASKRLSFSALLEQEKLSRGIPASVSYAKDREEPIEDSKSGGARRWVRWMHRHGLKVWVVPSAIVASIWVKWCIGLGTYSGHATPPMFGDYEAQRHWMELTIHLPFREWYTYDLQYWGLDYPPLTAYASWLCGKVGSLINPSWFDLYTSRGIESPESKLFMRASVVALDTLIYVPALYTFMRTWQGTRSSRTQHVALVTLLFHPALLLIDFGHFQYNSVMLGLTLLALNAFAAGYDLLGAFFFVLSLGFKQMALYYAPAIGSYLLGKCIYLGPVHGSRLFMRLAFTVTLTLILLFAPFLPPLSPSSTILAPVSRIFPFARGLFEDKVANFWCFTNVLLIKWKRMFEGREGILIKASAGLTVLGFLPGAAGLLWGGWKARLQPADLHENKTQEITVPPIPTPTLPLLPYALLTSSMSFFLFSFQVHEKTILLPLLPLTLLLSGASLNEEVWMWGVLGNNVGVFSMWPLLKKDGLGVQYFAMLLLWNRMVGHDPFRLRPNSLVAILSIAVYVTAFLLHALELLVPPPARYPDLFPVLNVLVCTPVFGLVWLWSIKRGIEVGWAIGGLPGSGAKKSGDLYNGTPKPKPNPAMESVRRDFGVRAMSLGYAPSEARRRALESLRAGSVERDVFPPPLGRR
ncbi:glycosyltransferase family 57 protein [Hygrophoropsis aurantiaca]|uniref:Glycosyltransferase family 57 protein n=1 Tax=Hygrophoropsis aurantiaca TaxID=72124 RepID=A0ACB8ASX4_9AGAM|nr:glycosyltransferase family 57 protein [Hygrophoropsis aurantiaca]